MQNLESLRRAALASDAAAAEGFVVERIVFADEASSQVEVFAARPSALNRFRELTGEEMTEVAALRFVAEGGYYRPAFKVRLETAAQYCLLYDLDRSTG